jgi:hypothetical protein
MEVSVLPEPRDESPALSSTTSWPAICHQGAGVSTYAAHPHVWLTSVYYPDLLGDICNIWCKETECVTELFRSCCEWVVMTERSRIPSPVFCGYKHEVLRGMLESQFCFFSTIKWHWNQAILMGRMTAMLKKYVLWVSIQSVTKSQCYRTKESFREMRLERTSL